MTKKLLISFAVILCAAGVRAQGTVDESMNPLITAMPSQSIAPDARAAGMGDLGVSTEADFNAQYWNPAKYAYMYTKGGITANYTPWLRKLVTDIDLAYLAGFYNFGDLAGGLGIGFTYFSMGDVTLTDGSGQPLPTTVRPNEWALDLSYFRKLHEYVSMSVAVRMLYSDLNNGHNSSMSGGTEMHPAITAAADIALYYRQPLDLPTGTSHLALGFSLKNLGGKMTYDEVTSNFIPASMNLGLTYEIPFNKYNGLSVTVEANKMMVPSRKSKFTTIATAANPELWDASTGKPLDPNNMATWQMSQDAYSALNPAKGWFQSFGDAPRGAKEEFQEVRWGAGLEYNYNKQFFARAGYSYENFYKGNRNYLTFGAGFHLSIVTLDVSYCVGLAASNPLDQTMRFTLGFDLYGIKDLVNNKK